MAPQRTSRRLASTYHRFPETLNVSPRRHPMLLRSMATPTDSSHSIVLETSGSLPALESTTNCSADPQSDSSLSPLHSLSELPSKPVVPVELLATTDGNIIRNMEMFCTRSQRLYNEQEGSLKYTKKCINLAEQQCADLKKIKHMRNIIQKLDYCCPVCRDLAWNSHVLACGHTVCSRCISNGRQQFVVSGKVSYCPVCRFPVCRKPIPSTAIQSVVERIGKETGIEAPPQHYLTWPEYQNQC
ncbi:uncharacterized protein C8R40DRAFT_1171910 [Lentinula edodes]|uniref:uncharacterized protein n=1 Tax=Lentinula edodes TaxID=5353 RepID=UPI001E8DA383|nr:uncharacterized protein C8R40DRAFT_1171910 [Lentinula edodes]KAH7873981.1 hypothetical protein C8R40DRAFT_1171910 [Lentinula edodes]